MLFMDWVTSLLQSKKTRQKEKGMSDFLENGSKLLEGLIGSSNGTYDVPFRIFTAIELTRATSNFSSRWTSDATGFMFRASLQYQQAWVKRYHTRNDSIRLLDYVIRDVVISLQMSRHKNVLKLIGCCLEFEIPALVYEYAGEQKLLSDIYNTGDHSLLSWKNRLKIAADIGNSIVYLHTKFSTPVVHRDLGIRNVMIDEYGVARLLDFSLCVVLPPGESQIRESIVLGATEYIEPEYLTTGIITEKSDVYRYGMLLLVLLTGKKNLYVDGDSGCIIDHQVDRVYDLREYLESVILGVSVEAKHRQEMYALLELALRCIQSKGDDRPEVADVAKEARRIHRAGLSN